MLIGILKGIPWWVYILFVFILIKGVQALKPRVIPLKKLFITPGLFAMWGLYSLISFKFNTLKDFFVWFCAMMVGLFWGYRITRVIPIKADKKKQLIALEGGLTTLVLSMLIFATKFSFGYFYATHPGARQNWVFVGVDLIVTGVIIGLLFGRSICYWNRFQRANQTDLSEKS
jgi:hypothetical protein